MTSNRNDDLYESLRELILRDTHEFGDDVPGVRCEEAHDWSGGRVGAYAIGSKVGEGATAKVYRAVHLDLEREVAIKIKKPGDHGGALALERFRKEGMRMASLAHPNIAVVHDVGVTRGAPWIAMELLDLPGSAAWATVRDPEATEVLAFLRALVEGVAHAHDRDLVHRDLKPENILFRPDGAPVIVDFGLSRALEDPHATCEGRPVGTPAYMAPEQVRGSLSDIDKRTDVHALGVLAFAWLTGRLPYEGEDREACFEAILTGVPPRLTSVHPKALGLDHVISTCLAKDPKDRYRDAGELLAELDRVAAGEPVRGLVIGWRDRLQRSFRRRRLALATFGVSSALLFLAILWVNERASRSASEDRQALLSEALAIEKLDGAAADRLRPLERSLAGAWIVTGPERRKLLSAVDAALAGLEDRSGTLAGWRSWMRLLVSDPGALSSLETLRRDYPDNPFLDILVARHALRSYARSCPWPAQTFDLYPTDRVVTVARFEEPTPLIAMRESARAALEDARRSPLWPVLSRSWMATFVSACEAHARGDHAGCRAGLEPVLGIDQVAEDAGLLTTLASAHLGDFEAAMASSEAVERSSPGMTINLFHRAHLLRIEATSLLAAGEDERESHAAAVAAFEKLSVAGLDVEASLAELDVASAIGIESRGGDPTSLLRRAVTRLDDVIASRDKPTRQLLTRSGALQRLARRAGDRSATVALLRRAARGYRAAAADADDWPLIEFAALQVEASLLNHASRSGEPFDADAWVRLGDRRARAASSGLPTFQAEYLDGVLAFFEAESRLNAKRDPEARYRYALGRFTALARTHSEIHELSQMTIVIRTRLFERDPSPDGQELLTMLEDLDRLIEAAPRFAILRRFSRKLLLDVRDRVVAPPPALRERMAAIR